MPAREVVRRRERLAVRPVRALLGDGRSAERAPHRDAAKRPRLASQLARYERSISVGDHWRQHDEMMLPAPPLRDVLDDEEVLARAHVAERPRLAPRGRHPTTRAADAARARLAPSAASAPPRAGLLAASGRRSSRAAAGSRGARRARARPARTSDGRSVHRGAGGASSSQPSSPSSAADPRSSGYWTTSTLMTFVVPGMLTAVPAVITTLSPLSTMPASRAASTASRHSSSTSRGLGDLQRRHAPLERELAHRPVDVRQRRRSGRRGRSRATAFAVRPVKVGTRIAFACSASAMSHAAFDIAWPIVGFSCASGSSCR